MRRVSPRLVSGAWMRVTRHTPAYTEHEHIRVSKQLAEWVGSGSESFRSWYVDACLASAMEVGTAAEWLLLPDLPRH
jgi:hypothetical protein